jgi:hypothetical protein
MKDTDTIPAMAGMVLASRKQTRLNEITLCIVFLRQYRKAAQ